MKKIFIIAASALLKMPPAKTPMLLFKNLPPNSTRHLPASNLTARKWKTL